MVEKPAFRGAISLGSLLIPMRIVKATKSHDVAFHEYHTADLARTGRKKVCKGCEADLTEGDISKGLEITKGQIMTFTKEELESLPLSTTRNIEIDRFVEAKDLNPIMFDAVYYVLPEEIGAKAYDLFLKGLKKLHKIAIGKVAIRQREHICALQPMNGGLVLSTMYYADEIRDMPQVLKVQTNDAELELITQVINKFSKAFDHDAYADNYTEAIKTIADAKLAGKKVPTAPAPQAQQVPNLEDALRDLLSKLNAWVSKK